ncbi:hypothetical protein [Lacrimispora amygdalina]|nr:hypothetical protein [Lacrimispora amygdalina]
MRSKAKIICLCCYHCSNYGRVCTATFTGRGKYGGARKGAGLLLIG